MRLTRFSFVTICMMVSGCAYKGVVPYKPFSTELAVSAIPMDVYYKKDSGKLRPLQIAQGPTTYHIEVKEAVDGGLLDVLKTRFRSVVSTPSDATLLAEPSLVSNLRHLDSHGNAFIDTRLTLVLSDARTGSHLQTFEVSDSISYTPPATATAMQWLTGLSCFILAPVTIPVMVNSAGDKALDMAEDTIADMVLAIDSELMASRRELLSYVSDVPSLITSPTVADSSLHFRSKYDDILACVVVIRTRSGTGTGFFINNTGRLITNRHVVGHEGKPSVRTRNGQSVIGKVVAVDEHADLAIVETGIEETPWLPLGTKADIDVGADVIAIGTPQGLDWSISKGIVSAVRESGDCLYVQTDAAINQGNSGGPLVLSENGKVLGVNTLTIKKNIGEGLGFAISVDDVRRVFSDYTE
jgi:S1-C subfamily serine protease